MVFLHECRALAYDRHLILKPVSRAITQVVLASTYMETESNISAISDLIGLVVSAQTTSMVVGQNAQAIAGEYFRLSAGVYDVATIGEVEVNTPMR